MTESEATTPANPPMLAYATPDTSKLIHPAVRVVLFILALGALAANSSFVLLSFDYISSARRMIESLAPVQDQTLLPYSLNGSYSLTWAWIAHSMVCVSACFGVFLAFRLIHGVLARHPHAANDILHSYRSLKWKGAIATCVSLATFQIVQLTLFSTSVDEILRLSLPRCVILATIIFSAAMLPVWITRSARPST